MLTKNDKMNAEILKNNMTVKVYTTIPQKPRLEKKLDRNYKGKHYEKISQQNIELNELLLGS